MVSKVKCVFLRACSVLHVIMPKRKLEEELEEDWADGGTKIKPGNKKNSLDSDEEDDGEERTYDILAENEIEGEFLRLKSNETLNLVCNWYVRVVIVVISRVLFVIYIQVKKREQLDLMVMLELPHSTCKRSYKKDILILKAITTGKKKEK